MTGLSVERLRRARDVLAERLRPTPLIEAGAAVRSELWLKCECLQPTGSFKIRGATYRISTLSSAERALGVVAYSTGNHAQAVARAAADAGTRATIVMSPDAPAAKVDAAMGWGASMVMTDPTSSARRAMAETLAHETGATLIAPYDDLDVMAGQGSIGFELADQLDGLAGAVVYVPVGGGGLIAGVAAALKAIEPACTVIGVEPEWEADAAASFTGGAIVAAAGPSASIADAVKVQELGALTFPVIRAFVDAFVTVTEGEIARRTTELFERHHLVVEPSGAISFAAATRRDVPIGGRRVAVLSGGNITIDRLQQLRHRTESSVESAEAIGASR